MYYCKDSARCQWVDSLCQKIIESPALLQRSPSYDCKTMVFGLESLRLLVKHWRVAMTDRKETSEPMQGIICTRVLHMDFQGQQKWGKEGGAIGPSNIEIGRATL